MPYIQYTFTLEDKKIFSNPYYNNNLMDISSLEEFFYKYNTNRKEDIKEIEQDIYVNDSNIDKEQFEELELLLNKKGICPYQYLVDWQIEQPKFRQGQLGQLMEVIVQGIKADKIKIVERSDHRQLVESFIQLHNIKHNEYKKMFDNRFYIFKKIIELNPDKLEQFIVFLESGNQQYPFSVNMQRYIKSYVESLPSSVVAKYPQIHTFYQSLLEENALKEEQFIHYRLTIDSNNIANKLGIKDSDVQRRLINVLENLVILIGQKEVLNDKTFNLIHTSPTKANLKEYTIVFDFMLGNEENKKRLQKLVKQVINYTIDNINSEEIDYDNLKVVINKIDLQNQIELLNLENTTQPKKLKI